jgi:hypothetical protein
VQAAYGAAYLEGARRAAVLFPAIAPGLPTRVERLEPERGVALLQQHVLADRDDHAPWRDLAHESGLPGRSVSSSLAALVDNPAYSWHRVRLDPIQHADLATHLARALPRLEPRPGAIAANEGCPPD